MVIMVLHMTTNGHYFQVIGVVVGFVAVLMMNNFIASQWSIKQRFHNNTMLSAVSAVFIVHAHITMIVDTPTTFPFNRTPTACMRTKTPIASLNIYKWCHKWLLASFTYTLDFLVRHEIAPLVLIVTHNYNIGH